MKGIEDVRWRMHQTPSRVSSAIAGTLEVAQTPNSHSLIPVLVTGIQPPRVCAVKDSYEAKAFLASEDLDTLDSCDEHRNEGVLIGPFGARERHS